MPNIFSKCFKQTHILSWWSLFFGVHTLTHPLVLHTHWFPHDHRPTHVLAVARVLRSHTFARPAVLLSEWPFCVSERPFFVSDGVRFYTIASLRLRFLHVCTSTGFTHRLYTQALHAQGFSFTSLCIRFPQVMPHAYTPTSERFRIKTLTHPHRLHTHKFYTQA